MKTEKLYVWEFDILMNFKKLYFKEWEEFYKKSVKKSIKEREKKMKEYVPVQHENSK